MHRLHINIIFLLFLAYQVNGQTNDGEIEKIKLKSKCDSSMVHFQSGDYTISFNLADLKRIYNDLDIPLEIKKKDTLEFRAFIKSIDSTGKGNWTNNFRFNLMLRELIDNGKVEVYCLSRNNYLRTIHKKVEIVLGAGTIYFYLDRRKTIIQFNEAFVGCPNF